MNINEYPIQVVHTNGVPTLFMPNSINEEIVAPNGTDDTTAIQGAINKLSALGGGLLRLISGTYNISSSITLADGISIEGIRPSLTFTQNCPDLGFVANGGTVLKATTTGIDCFIGNTTGSSLDPISNVKIKNMLLKGFRKGVFVGQTDELGMGMGGFESLYIDGTGDDNTTVQTALAFHIINSQQMYCHDIMIYKVTEGIRVVNDTATCSSGNSVWIKPYIYMDTSTSALATTTITTVTVASDQITVSDASSFSAGDIIGISGNTGSSASQFNRTHVIKSITGNDIVLQDDLNGLTLNNDGTVSLGRVGIHLQSKQSQPLNHATFISPQVNWFLGSEQLKGFCNFAITGHNGASVTNASLTEVDAEGNVDNHIFMSGATQCDVSLNATVNVPTNGTFLVELGLHNKLHCADPDATVVVGKSVNPLHFSGSLASVGATSNSLVDTLTGHYYDSTNTKHVMGFATGTGRSVSGSTVNAEFVKPATRCAFGDNIALTVSGTSQTLNGNHYGTIKVTAATSTITLPPTASDNYTGGIIRFFCNHATPNITIAASTGSVRGTTNITTQYGFYSYMCVDGANDEWAEMF